MRAIIFDLDDTLVHSRIDFAKMKSETIKFVQSVGVTPGLLNDRMLNFEIMRVSLENLRGKGFSEEEIQRVLAGVNEIMNQVELESFDRATVIDGVPETLGALKTRGLKIGIMTRSCREYTERVLAKFGLTKYVDAFAARDDVEKPKPSPEHAFHLLRLLDVPVEEALLVGDHWLDAQCAREAGLRFIMFRRQEQGTSASKESDYQIIKDIREIVDIAGDVGERREIIY